jgi:hypothetical protein
VLEELADGKLRDHLSLNAAKDFGEVYLAGVVVPRHDPMMGYGDGVRYGVSAAGD